jgi:hypothetical protein
VGDQYRLLTEPAEKSWPFKLMIDPDGIGIHGKVEPFQVQCLKDGHTQIDLLNPEAFFVGNSSSQKINYAAKNDQIEELIDYSGHCYQSIEVDCFDATLDNLFTWTDKNGNQHNSLYELSSEVAYHVDYEKEDSCVQEYFGQGGENLREDQIHPSIPCTCDQKSKNWKTNFGRISNKVSTKV